MLCCIFNDRVSLFDYRAGAGPLAEITQHLLQTNLISHDAMQEMTLYHSAVVVELKTDRSVGQKCLNF